jgi:tetratricopeptide (TPR) repeat protein
LNRLAILYYDTQRFSNVEKHFLGVLAIYERLAANYPKAYGWLLAQALTNLGELYCKMHRFSEVEECYFRSLAIFKRLATTYAYVYGPSYVYTLNNVSEYSLLVQKYAQAEEYSREALKWSDDINIYTNLAAAILLQGRFEEAKQIYLTYKDDLRDTFLEDFQALKDNNAIPEHIIGDVEKIIELLNS